MTISRRKAMGLLAGAAGALATLKAIPAKAAKIWWKPTPAMDTITTIRTRRSVRSYTDQEVPEAMVNEILGAAMSAPSAGNDQPWEFIVIRDKETLKKASGLNRYARYAKNAPVGILVCGNLERNVKPPIEKFWQHGIAAAIQNTLLAAHASGLGAVWTGLYPYKEKAEGFRNLIEAPENIVPVALVLMGYPKRVPAPIDRFEKDRIHMDKWQG